MNMTNQTTNITDTARQTMAELSANLPAICDNCGEQCLTFKLDPTIVCGSKLDKRSEWMFRWGAECSCGKRRAKDSASTAGAR